MGMEQEIKLRARDGADPSLLPEDPALLPLRCSPMESIEMRTTYYDTEEHILARAKWALRCRTENGEPVITLKTPPDANHKRGEWELRGPGLVEQDEIQPGAFNALFAQGAPRQILDLHRCPLETLCRVDFLRRRCLLCLPEGTRVELALDKGTLYRGRRSAPFCEVELELKQGQLRPCGSAGPAAEPKIRPCRRAAEQISADDAPLIPPAPSTPGAARGDAASAAREMRAALVFCLACYLKNT